MSSGRNSAIKNNNHFATKVTELTETNYAFVLYIKNETLTLISPPPFFKLRGQAEDNEMLEKYKDYPESELTEKIIHACIEVHKTLGPGYLEAIYENSLVIEFEKEGIKYEQQKPTEIYYKNNKVGEQRIDLLIEGRVIVELKSISGFEDIHKAQIISYLTAMKLKVGLLINFGKTKIDVDRIVV